MNPQIFRADAYVNDRAALDKLLETVPERDSMRLFLLSNLGSCQVWDSESNRDYWLSSDGEVVTCITIADLTWDRAVIARVLFDARNPEIVVDEAFIRSIVADAIGQQLSLVH